MNPRLVALLALALPLAACSQERQHLPSGQVVESSAPAHRSIPARERAVATAVARRAVASARATVYSATVTAGRGKVLRNSNTGHLCTSGRLLHVKLIGSFPHTVTTGHPVRPGDPPPDFTVRAMVITADASSGLDCLIGVQTRENGEPKPQPHATVLDLH